MFTTIFVKLGLHGHIQLGVSLLIDREIARYRISSYPTLLDVYMSSLIFEMLYKDPLDEK